MIFVFIFILFLASVNSNVQRVYTVSSLKSFQNKGISEIFSCNEQNTAILLGSYYYPVGMVDALQVVSSPYTYQLNICSFKYGRYIKLFGSMQNYNSLLSQNPKIVAQTIKNIQMMKDSIPVIDWNHEILKLSLNQVIKSREWIYNFTNEFLPNSLLKIPSYMLCYHPQNQDLKYLLGIQNIAGYVLQLYGTQHSYLTYNQIFKKNLYQQQGKYTSECPRDPSVSFAKNLIGNKKLFIEKTLNQQRRGYVGPQIEQWLKNARAENIYTQPIFFDNHPKNMFHL